MSQQPHLPRAPLEAVFVHAFHITLLACVLMAGIGVVASLLRGPRGNSYN